MMNCVPTLRSSQGGEGVGMIEGMGKLRRLTVTEWERLQGFPDGYTACTHQGKPASDKQRQHALGNAFPPPFLNWLGGRIARLERLKKQELAAVPPASGSAPWPGDLRDRNP